jgi:NADP-dependent alcohol dehydrogenase
MKLNDSNLFRQQESEKIMQVGARVFGVSSGTHDFRINETIRKTREFFNSLGLTTSLSENNIGREVIDEIEHRFNERDVHFGEDGLVTGTVAKEILNKVY